MILLAAALAQVVPLAPPDLCPTICDAKKLRPYFDKLARLPSTRGVVRILQIGDSHTAGDQITGAWRTVLQARYGNAGRGVLAPGRPYQGYLTKDVTARQGAGWTVSGIFGPTYGAADSTPHGLANFSLTSISEGATLSIAADRGSFDSFTVCALTGPGAGTLTLTLGGVVRPVTLAADRVTPRCEHLDADAPAAGASLTASGGPVIVTSWATERAGPGVILSNLGIVGAQLVHFARTDDRVIAAEVAQFRPDLLVVAFGTNEAFMPGFTAAGYASRLRTALDRLKRLFPDIPRLMLGAPDSATTRPELQTGESGTSPPCDADPGAPNWRPTAALATVQATQRRIAHEEGWAFWDWGTRMGGRCTSLSWSRTGMMRPDHVHFTNLGAAEIARRLQADLDAAAFAVGAER